jgi:hypothetical protein
LHLPLLPIEAVIGSITGMLDLSLDVIDHIKFSRRGARFKLSRPLAEPGDCPMAPIVDSSGPNSTTLANGTPTSRVTGSVVAGRSFTWL